MTGWVSTRSPSAEPIGFSEAMLRGLAPDGGLYVPTGIPHVEFDGGTTFQDLAVRAVLPWLDSGIDAEVEIRSALDFPVPLVEVRPGVFVVELFHGPTLSFKDFGARTMARLLRVAVGDSRESRTVFVATSGDTGSAVADGFSGLDGVRVVLLYPDGQVSPVQERQLVAPRPGVLPIRVRGAFDDCQRMVKGVFADRRFDRFGPTSANSINVGRLVPQTTYHGWAATRIPGAVHVVPSGNLGNLTAAVMARRAGAPTRSLVAAHNANRGFPDFLEGGRRPDAPSVSTLSNAMDVGTPSNFERLESMMAAEELRQLVTGLSVSDRDTLESIRRTHGETGYLADPHTAVGLEAVRRMEKSGVAGPFVVMSTAHPAKFPETVRRATGVEADEPPRLAGLAPADATVPWCEPSLDALAGALDAWPVSG